MSRIGLGGVFLATDLGFAGTPREAVGTALDLGISYIDTAPTYGNSEAILGEILRDAASPLVLSTKLGGRPEPFDAQDAAALEWSFEESLRLLGRDHVDILYIHEADRPGQWDWWSDPERLDGPVMEVLARLKASGRISYIGVGGTTAYQLARLVRTGLFDVVLTAFNFSILWREAAIDLLPAAAELGVGVVVGSPLQQGALSRRHDVDGPHNGWLSPPRREQFRALYRLVDELDIPLPELGLRFVISNPLVDSVLTGARSAHEVRSNVEAVERGPLPADILERLDAIASMVPFRPFDEPAELPFGRPFPGPGPMR